MLLEPCFVGNLGNMSFDATKLCCASSHLYTIWIPFLIPPPPQYNSVNWNTWWLCHIQKNFTAGTSDVCWSILRVVAFILNIHTTIVVRSVRWVSLRSNERDRSGQGFPLKDVKVLDTWYIIQYLSSETLWPNLIWHEIVNIFSYSE